MSGRALRRNVSIHMHADRPRTRIYAPGISFTGHSRFFYSARVSVKVTMRACGHFVRYKT